MEEGLCCSVNLKMATGDPWGPNSEPRYVNELGSRDKHVLLRWDWRPIKLPIEFVKEGPLPTHKKEMCAHLDFLCDLLGAVDSGSSGNNVTRLVLWLPACLLGKYQ